jgi:DNA ligase 1
VPVRELVLDGEAVALQPDGRPHPFQDTASRIGSRRDIDRLRAELPLSTFFFDVLHVDGEDLLDHSANERHAVLTALVPVPPVALAPPPDPAGTASARQVSAATRRPPAGIGRIPRLVTADPARAAEFFADAVARGHEGVVVKSLDTPYTAGRRGAGWIKVKPRHTLDLVILAAEWGHGRRRGWLSNLHLGARDPRTGEFVMLGKTFKGLTDKLLTWQTEQFLARAVEQDDWLVRVKPDLVVEIAFDGVQRSSRYPGGVALRFARVLRYRPDKPPEEADTIDTVRLLGGLAS